MIGLVGILALLTVLALSMVITKIATIALASTGLSHEAAKFQARSAFTGTGFTTKEAEKIVDHPIRRRIIHLLMLLRSAGIISILISLILSFAGSRTGSDIFLRLSLLAAGLLVLLGLVNTKAVNRYLTQKIETILQRWSDMDTRDYASLLKLSGDYRVLEMQIRKNDWIEGKTLEDCKLDQEGVRVLGIYRHDGSYLGVPKGTAKLRGGDTLVLYGDTERVRELDKRRADAQGESAHEDAVRQHCKKEDEEARKDEESTSRESQEGTEESDREEPVTRE